MQEAAITCVRNFDVFCRKIKEIFNQNPICKFEMMLLNRYPYEKSEIIVYDHSIEVFSILWIWDNHLPCVCIGTLLKGSILAFLGITKIGRWLPRPDCTPSLLCHSPCKFFSCRTRRCLLVGRIQDPIKKIVSKSASKRTTNKPLQVWPKLLMN